MAATCVGARSAECPATASIPFDFALGDLRFNRERRVEDQIDVHDDRDTGEE